MPTLFPGDLDVVASLHDTIECTWEVFDVVTSNKPPPLHGVKFLLRRLHVALALPSEDNIVHLAHVGMHALRIRMHATLQCHILLPDHRRPIDFMSCKIVGRFVHIIAIESIMLVRIVILTTFLSGLLCLLLMYCPTCSRLM